MVNVPLRLTLLGFAAAVNVTLPFPLPLAPVLMVNQLAPLLAVQLQPAAAVTATLLAPPAAGLLRLEGLTR